MPSKHNYYLTEMILSIQNEVQSALDYLSETATTQGTELGMSQSVMGIENLRIRLPFQVELEQKTASVPISPAKNDLESLRKNLVARKGFMIDKGLKGKLANFTKVKVLSMKPSDTNDAVGIGEIEIVFSPIRRE